MRNKSQAALLQFPPSALSFEMDEASLWFSAQVTDPFRKGQISSDFEVYGLEIIFSSISGQRFNIFMWHSFACQFSNNVPYFKKLMEFIAALK